MSEGKRKDPPPWEKHPPVTGVVSAADQPESVVVSVPAATSASTARPPKASATTTTPSSDTTPGTPTSTGSGHAVGVTVSATGTPNSERSSEPSLPSTGHWAEPIDPMTFAAQANAVATGVLNGTIDLDTARTYAAVARTVAQAMNTEVNRARLEQSLPNLSLHPERNYR